MTLELLAIAAMFTMPILLAVIALTGETSLRGLLRALVHASKTGYAAETEDVPASQ